MLNGLMFDARCPQRYFLNTSIMNFDNLLFLSGDAFLPKPIRDFLSIFIYRYPDTADDTGLIFYLQWWSIVHLLSGIVIGYYARRLPNYYVKMLMIHTIWEIWQIFIGMNKPYNIGGRNGLVDTITDTILFMIGTYLASRFH